MATSELQESVANLLARHPTWIRRLESLHIDYCCHGNSTWEEACRVRGLDPGETLDELHHGESPLDSAHPDASQLTVDELVDHIVQVHHAYLRDRLPIIDELFAEVLLRHGGSLQDIAKMKTIFHGLREELETHMIKEELVLFPWAKRKDQPNASQSPPFSIAMPIRAMEREHDDAGRALEQLRELSANYTPPAEACALYRGLLEHLADLEQDLHLHIHEENNVLFPRLLNAKGGDMTSSP